MGKMNIKRFAAGLLIVTMLMNGMQLAPAFADTVQNLTDVPVDSQRNGSDSATPEDAEDTASVSNTLTFSLKSNDIREYQLEAENTEIASWSNANLNEDGMRMELQKSGSVTYHLAQVEGFVAGDYLVSVQMNGNSTSEEISINGVHQGPITKAGAEWDMSAMSEYYYHGVVSLKADDTLTVKEAADGYAHLDWAKLERVDQAFWIEAEDSSTTSLENGAAVHGEGDRVELNAGQKIVFDLSKVSGFRSGVHELYAGANGARTSLGVEIDDENRGEISTPGAGKWEKGTCMDCAFTQEVELKADSTIRLSDIGESWGHVDYIRLVRTGDATPKFDATDEDTGIRVVAEQGVLPDGTKIKADTIRKADKKDIREFWKAQDKKASFYCFHLEDSKGKEIDLNNLPDGGEVLAYLPIPAGYSQESELYYTEESEDDPQGLSGYDVENGKFKLQLDACGIYMAVDEDSWQFEGEDYYGKTSDGGSAADLQPSEEIRFTIPDDESFESGLYNLFVRACGYQNYTIRVDDTEKAKLTRESTEWGSYERYTVPAVLKLSRGQVISIGADDNYGWVDSIQLVPCKPFEEEDSDVRIQAEAGVVPSGAEMSVKAIDEVQMDEIRSLFGFAEDHAPLMSFYDISLLIQGEKIQPAGKLTIRIPVPEDFNPETLSVYYLPDGIKKIRIPFKLVEDGQYAEIETDHLSLYGIVNQALGNEFYYSAADYYDRSAEEGLFADLQPEGAIEIPVKDNPGFVESNYRLFVRACGDRTRLMVKVNGIPVGMIERESTGFSDDSGDMKEAEFGMTLHLAQEDVITVYAPGTEDLGPFGWIDYVKIKETDKEPAELPAAKKKITLEAEDYYPDVLEADGKAANINNPSKKLEIPVLAADGIAEGDYQFTLYTTGTMRAWQLSVNGSVTLTGTRAGSGYEMKYMTKEIGSELLHLKPGDVLSLEFLEQDTDNFGNWVDKIVLNGNRRAPSGDLLSRTGGRIQKELEGKFMNINPSSTSSKDGKLIYQGEAYYTKQKDNPAADLQPGEQILIPVSDNGSFTDGKYRVQIQSCGNRESFQIKVNGRTVGSISRKETNYGMDSMTEDTMGTLVDLKAGDTLIVEGQSGGKYGWVDCVTLKLQEKTNQKNQNYFSWEAEDFYTKQKDNPAADLQPGEAVPIPLSSNDTFTAGTYYIAVISNGDRTMMQVDINGTLLGSITRNKTNFSMEGMSMDALLRPVSLTPGDTVSLVAQGEQGSETGPWGWVDRMVLIPAPELNPQQREEYRYPAQAYGKATAFLAAADMQPEESLVIPLSDNRELAEGDYHVMVISNGTREQFVLKLNGQSVGEIHREKSDYGDNGMSSDELPSVLHLKPSDVLSVTAQAGDFYGWVSAVVLEPTR